jgi:hypothetical protein
MTYHWAMILAIFAAILNNELKNLALIGWETWGEPC